MRSADLEREQRGQARRLPRLRPTNSSGHHTVSSCRIYPNKFWLVAIHRPRNSHRLSELPLWAAPDAAGLAGLDPRVEPSSKRCRPMKERSLLPPLLSASFHLAFASQTISPCCALIRKELSQRLNCLKLHSSNARASDIDDDGSEVDRVPV